MSFDGSQDEAGGSSQMASHPPRILCSFPLCISWNVFGCKWQGPWSSLRKEYWLTWLKNGRVSLEGMTGSGAYITSTRSILSLPPPLCLIALLSAMLVFFSDSSLITTKRLPATLDPTSSSRSHFQQNSPWITGSAWVTPTSHSQSL